MADDIKIKYTYKYAPTLLEFSNCKKRVRAVIGAFGSGKSSACVMEIFQRACEQTPEANGIRRTKYIVVRSTYRQLIDTTIATFFEWLPPSVFGEYNKSNHRYSMRFPLPDGTTMESEIIFRALDREEHVANLLSLEVSGAWLNEYREISKVIFDGVDGRIGRFPPVKGVGCDYPFIIMDSNPPDFDHWTYKLFEEDVPDNIELAQKFQIFHQPSGLSAQAENMPFLPKNYYKNMAVGKDEEYINVYIHGQYGYVRTGRQVYTNYIDDMHFINKPIDPIRGIPIIIGMDFELNPAAVFTQYTPDGHFNIMRETVAEGTPLRGFLEYNVLPIVKSYYARHPIIVVGDPSGVRRSGTDGSTCFLELSRMGFKAVPANTNSFQARFGAVNSLLTKISAGEDGKPDPILRVSSECPIIRKGFVGEYKFPEMKTRSGLLMDDRPLKNSYSHPHDALQYAALGYESASMAREIRRTYESEMTNRKYTPSTVRAAFT